MNSNFYARAESEIKRRREFNTKELNSRKDEIEKLIPEYRGFQRELAQTGEKLCQLILNGENIKEKLEKLQNESLNAQERIKLLLFKIKQDSEYLSEIYTCNKCRDTGIYQNRRCSCFKEIVKRLASEELNAAAPIKLSSFNLFDLNFYPDKNDADSGVNIKSKMTRNFKYCEDYAENFHLPCEGILMQGNTGLGKTHLSLSIAKEIIDKGFSVIYGSAPDLLRKIEKEHFGRASGMESDTAGLLQSADLLIFDDLGAEFESQFYISAFYNLLNSRINAGLPTIVSTNFELSQLKKRYNDRIISRLLTMECLVFYGEDIRINKKFNF